MLIELLLSLAQATMQAAISLRPPWELHVPPVMANGLALLWSLDYLIPVTEAFTCAALGLGLLGVMWSWKWIKQAIDWVMDIIP